VAATDAHPFEEAFGDLFRALNELPFPYCLVGALALGAWGTPRATHDLDAMIAIGHTDRHQLLQALTTYGFTEDAQWAEHDPMIRDYHVRLQRGAIPVDLMLPGDNVKCWVCSLLGIALPDSPCCMSETLTPSSSVPSWREERESTVSLTTRC